MPIISEIKYHVLDSYNLNKIWKAAENIDALHKHDLYRRYCFDYGNLNGFYALIEDNSVTEEDIDKVFEMLRHDTREWYFIGNAENPEFIEMHFNDETEHRLKEIFMNNVTYPCTFYTDINPVIFT